MKTKFTTNELVIIKKWLKDASITPIYITMYRYPKQGACVYRLMVSDSQKYSTMDFLNPELESFDTIALTRQLSKIFDQTIKINVQ